MIDIIDADARAIPSLFRWNGPVDQRRLEKWLSELGWTIPADLLQLWVTTGGGEILESERILSPMRDDEGVDEVALATARLRASGGSNDLVAFHEGLGVTAVRTTDGSYVWFDGNLRLAREYRDLEKWYIDLLRREYASRYGLPPLPSVLK